VLEALNKLEASAAVAVEAVAVSGGHLAFSLWLRGSHGRSVLCACGLVEEGVREPGEGVQRLFIRQLAQGRVLR
jgi:hypothetical protein